MYATAHAFAIAITGVNRAIFYLTKWVVYAIAALMLYEVVSRYSFAAPTSWAPELARLLFGPFFLLGGPYLLHLGGHVAVDLVSAAATGNFKRTLGFLAMLLAAVFGAILLWFSLPLAWTSFVSQETSYSNWKPLLWPAKAALPVAAFLLTLQALAEMILLFKPEQNS